MGWCRLESIASRTGCRCMCVSIGSSKRMVSAHPGGMYADMSC